MVLCGKNNCKSSTKFRIKSYSCGTVQVGFLKKKIHISDTGIVKVYKVTQQITVANTLIVLYRTIQLIKLIVSVFT